MNFKWIINFYYLGIVASTTPMINPEQNPKTSEEYLKEVILELHQLQSSSSVHPFYPAVENLHYLAGKRYSGMNAPRVKSLIFSPKKVEPIDPMEAAANDYQFYHQQVPRQVVMPNEPVRFTKDELSGMYKQALESGNAISISALRNSLESGHLPAVVGNHLHIPSHPNQMYGYYFYPLKSFMNNLQDNHGYKTINDYIPVPEETFNHSPKQIVLNPLFMAVSGFIGMALMFMISVLVLPRIFGEFRSRIVHDELLNLTKTVSEAIDLHNSTTIRPNFSSKIVYGVKTKIKKRVPVNNKKS